MNLDVKPKRYRTLRCGKNPGHHGDVKVIARSGKFPSELEQIRIDEKTIKAELLRRSASRSELAVVDGFRELGFDHSVPMAGYYLDFYNADLKVCIEIDGPIHKDRKVKDKTRDAALRAHGIRTWRFRAEWAYARPKSLVAYVAGLIQKHWGT